MLITIILLCGTVVMLNLQAKHAKALAERDE